VPKAESIATEILAAPAPVLFVDTCSLIDVGSGSARLREHRDLSDALFIRKASDENPPGCYIVTASLVEREFRDNIDRGVDELRKKIAALHDDASRLNADGILVGLPASQQLPDLGLPDLLKVQAEQLLGASRRIDHRQDYQTAACARALTKLRPSRSGTFKDCQIMIECLDVARLLANGGLPCPKVFLSSNTSDFAVEKGSNFVHSEIEPDFDLVGLSYASHWPAARRLLGI